MRLSALLFAAAVGFVGVASATDPPPSVRLPEVLAPVAPPNSVTKLTAGQWYIVDADTEQLVDAFTVDTGSISLAKKHGPITVPADVAVGRKPDADDPEVCTIKGPFVYIVKAKTTGKVLLDVMPTVNRVDAAGKPIPFTRSDIIRRVLDVNAGPRPPPPPPVSTFTLSAAPSAGLAPLAVQFTATGDPADLTGAVLDFGDGGYTVYPAGLNHTYAAAGPYTAKLTALAGKTATAVVTVTGTPAPQPVTSFRVIYVTESATALTKTQNAVINSPANVAYLNSKATKTNNWPDWRSYDPQMGGEKDYPGLAAMWAAAKPAITTVPCVVIQVNDKVTIEPFPATAADALTLLKKYGGQ